MPKSKLLNVRRDLFLFPTLFAILLLVVFSTGQRPLAMSSPTGLAGPQRKTPQQLMQSYAKLPLSFEVNQGQTDPQVKFLSRGVGYSLFLSGNEAVLALGGGSPQSTVDSSQLHSPRTLNPELPNAEVLRMKVVGANPAAQARALAELPGKVNYFIGKNPGNWRTNVPTYAKVKFQGVYPGIDLVYYGNQQQLEYDFVVSPGADPHAIALVLESGNSKFEDRNSKMKIAANGDLVIATKGGEVRFRKPVAYQSKSRVNSRQSTGKTGGNAEFRTQKSEFLDCRYVLTAGNRVHFEISNYDRSKPLIIDPVLVYSTYLGGSGGDQGTAVAVDSSGSAYVTGSTGSADFPATTGAFQSSLKGSFNAFVTKFSPDGSGLIYSTFIGGSSGDMATRIALDSSGNAYLTGWTRSSDFPVVNAVQSNLTGQSECADYITDAFVTELSAGGNALVYSTYLNGNSGDSMGYGITVDSSGSAYVTGMTCSTSSGFPAVNAFQSTSNAFETGFVTKFAPGGSALVFSTYLGGSGTASSGYTSGSGIAVDSGGNVYVTGATTAADFPTANAFQAALNSSCDDAFVTKLTPDGRGLVYSTYLGGTGCNQAKAIAVDSLGDAYVAGGTDSTDFPTTPGAFQTVKAASSTCTSHCARDAFVTKFSPDGRTLVYSTFLGGTNTDDAVAIALDSQGDAFVTGTTSSSDFPTVNPVQPSFAGGFMDAFVSALAANGRTLVYSTYLGGSGRDGGGGIALDTSGNAYVTGWTQSSDFPTAQALQPGLKGVQNAFVTKISDPSPGTASTRKLK